MRLLSIIVGARNKTSTRPRSGLPRPLPIPSRPWSYIALDFDTGLPASEGNTTILTVIKLFSKAAHFVALRRSSSLFPSFPPQERLQIFWLGTLSAFMASLRASFRSPLKCGVRSVRL